MFRALGDFAGGPTRVDISFRDVARWSSLPSSAGTPLTTTAVLFGDDERGPALLLLHLAPGVTLPSSSAHGHASDSWRISLKGTLPMGPDSYDPCEFRFQHGWKPYASDNLANGPDGGWTALLFGDRRGMRPRLVRHGDGPEITDQDAEWATYLGIDGDLSSVASDATPGPSSFASTFDDATRGARINGSFHDAQTWVSGPSACVAAAAMGDADVGPVMLLVSLEPGAVAPVFPVRSDVVRITCDGELHSGGRILGAGDLRVQGPGELEESTAGPVGACEAIIVGDRRDLVVDGDSTWGTVLDEVLTYLRSRIAARADGTADPVGQQLDSAFC